MGLAWGWNLGLGLDNRIAQLRLLGGWLDGDYPGYWIGQPRKVGWQMKVVAGVSSVLGQRAGMGYGPEHSIDRPVDPEIPRFAG